MNSCMYTLIACSYSRFVLESVLFIQHVTVSLSFSGLIDSAALPMVNVPHDGMPLVDHTAHASTVRPLPPSPKKQQWSLMSRDAFQNSPVSSELMSALFPVELSLLNTVLKLQTSCVV